MLADRAKAVAAKVKAITDKELSVEPAVREVIVVCRIYFSEMQRRAEDMKAAHKFQQSDIEAKTRKPRVTRR